MFTGRALTEPEILRLMTFDGTPCYREGVWIMKKDWQRSLFITPEARRWIPTVPYVLDFSSKGRIIFSRLIYRDGDRISVRDLVPSQRKELLPEGIPGKMVI